MTVEPVNSQSSVRKLILVLGDQLTPELAALRDTSQSKDRILLVEVMEEATYAHHHKKKLAFIFSAMRHFAEDLRAAGWQVDYVTLDDPQNTGGFTTEAARAIERVTPERLVVTEPGEWRIAEMIRNWPQQFGVPVDVLEDARFICSRTEFAEWARDRKQLRMEFFYREMRRKTGLLMVDDQPEGQRWNFDSDNRKPARADLMMPGPIEVEPNQITRTVLRLVAEHFPDNFGDLEPFWFAVTAAGAERALDHFIDTTLMNFGDYQDAMLNGEKYLYHSVLSIYINAGLLDPLAVCRRVEKAYRAGAVPLNAAEGFIRQIIGWREYVRGIYWLKMPAYRAENYFSANAPLPSFYWSGETDMACLKAAITQTREEAYAHHIQRLMITGNFAMLAGVDPHQVHEWYLAVYADAYEWVELPNTLGMSQFADGGLLGSKPYAGGGNYINKMSDYCSSCRYDVKQKHGDGACPFNALYWDFLIRHRERLKNNHRLAQVYRTWDKMSDANRSAYLQSARKFRSALK